ncbi:MAG: PAS domain S-box protein [Isosphaeraceae bacterium]|nr:PAS domain S-box protein [Isosphaeraceae bacterium]
MSLCHTTEGPIDDAGSRAPNPTDDRRERLGMNLLSLGDAVIVTDASGKIILLNPVAESLTGWTDHDSKDRPIESVFRIIHEVTRQPVAQPVTKVIELGTIQNLSRSSLLVARDGSELAIDDSAAPILDAEGELDGVVLIFRDVTEHRQEELRLEDARHQNEVIIATVQDSLLVLDADLRVRSANRSFYETFQTSPAETIGQSLLTLGDGQWNIDGLPVALQAILTRETSFDDFSVERVFPAIGARVMLLTARRLRRKEGRENMILLAIEDVTERRRMTTSLAASELRFRRLFEAAKDGILILDGESGRITDANPYLLELLGYEHAELLGKELWEIGLFGDEEASRASFQELQQKGYVRYDDLPLSARGGRPVEVEVVSNVYRAGAQTIIQCNIRDVTARKRADEELRRAKEAAEEAGRTKDLFLATLSHELRTPLTPVLATVAYIEAMPSLPEELRAEFASIRRNVELEARLIDDLLDLTRIGQGKLHLEREAVDAHAVLRSAMEVCQDEVEAKKLEVSFALRAENRRVWADPARLQQVFWNLIKNAVKFTPAEGRISLRSAETETGLLAIEVADTGAGIEPQALSRIFDAFEQGDRHVARRHGGLGLGLAIAKMLVDLHGGTLTAASGGKGQGSVFRVELELIPRSADPNSQPDPAATEEEGKTKLLLVDDNADTLRAISLLLRSTGFVVRTATTVEEATAALSHERFDLLVSDIGLSDASGLDIMRQCRDTYATKGIALSGYGTPDDVMASEAAGFAHHLSKPSNLNVLVDLIRRTAS